MIVDDLFADGKAQPNSLGLRGHEGSGVLFYIRVEPLAFVLDHYFQNSSPHSRPGRSRSANGSANRDLCLDSDLTSRCGRFDRVLEKVQEHLEEPVPVTVQSRQAGVIEAKERQAGCFLGQVQKVYNLIEYFVDIYLRSAEFPSGDCGEEGFKEPVDTVNLTQYNFTVLHHRAVRCKFRTKKLGGALDPAEGVLDLVSHAEVQDTEGSKLVRTTVGTIHIS